MKVPRHILAQAIAKRTLHVTDVALLAREIAAYLLAERRVNELESILRDIMQYRMEHGALEAEVVAAHEVTEHVASEVKRILHTAYPNAKNIVVTQRIDTDLIGGLRVDLANEQLDMTVQSKLATFKRITA